jgi:twitching motility protein PilT
VSLPAIDKLGLPEAVRRLPDLDRGLVIVTGTTRSGRSTTLAALIDAVNATRAAHIVTIEDPIEFLHAHKQSVVNQRQVGDDTTGFAVALRQAMRHDPDVLMVGALPDVATISRAIAAAEAGLLVFATMHVPYAVEAIDRLIDVFPPEQQHQVCVQLASSLQAVVAQQLVPGKGGTRVLAAEVLVGNAMVRDFLREAKTAQLTAAMAVGGEGMQTMEQALARLVQVGHISLDTALDRCANPEELRRLVRTAEPSRRVAAIARSLEAESR